MPKINNSEHVWKQAMFENQKCPPGAKLNRVAYMQWSFKLVGGSTN